MTAGAEYATPSAGTLSSGFEEEAEARATVQGLTHLANEMRKVGGRKTIVYFAEAMTLRPQLEPYFERLLHAANRANVSIYPMDAAGLRVHSQQAEMGRALTGAVHERLASDASMSPDFFVMLATKLRSGDTPAVLSMLARETGGFAITHTNDLADGFARIDEDRESYYLLSYSPTNSRLDGSYRRIQVRVKRPGMTVRARSGYFASREIAR